MSDALPAEHLEAIERLKRRSEELRDQSKDLLWAMRCESRHVRRACRQSEKLLSMAELRKLRPGYPPGRSLEELVAEGELLLRQRLRCHKTLNDLAALSLMAKLHAKGFVVDRDEAEQCLRRMQIAVDTGIYPDGLLR